MPGWREYAAIAAGGALGSAARLWLTAFVTELSGPAFPWGTLLINVLGSFVIGWFGVLTGMDGRLDVPGDLRVFVMGGLCGGFTTFSAFSLQTLDLMQEGAAGAAAGYVLASVALCLLGVWLGVAAGRL